MAGVSAGRKQAADLIRQERGIDFPGEHPEHRRIRRDVQEVDAKLADPPNETLPPEPMRR